MTLFPSISSDPFVSVTAVYPPPCCIAMVTDTTVNDPAPLNVWTHACPFGSFKADWCNRYECWTQHQWKTRHRINMDFLCGTLKKYCSAWYGNIQLTNNFNNKNKSIIKNWNWTNLTPGDPVWCIERPVWPIPGPNNPPWLAETGPPLPHTGQSW